MTLIDTNVMLDVRRYRTAFPRVELVAP